MKKSSLIIGLLIISMVGCVSLKPQPAKNMSIQQIQQRFPGISRGWAAQIKRGGLAIGMTPAMVRLSWGDPSDVNQTTTTYGTTTQWVYNTRYYNPSCYCYTTIDMRFVYFEDGKVSGIQN